jgi:conjugal transfer pilus assembly protein TraE
MMPRIPLNDYFGEVAARLLVRRLFVVGFAASVATNVLLSAAVLSVEPKTQTIVLPAEPTKSFWLDDEKVSPEYLEQMALFVVQLTLNNSPETMRYNIEKVLRYVEPASRGALDVALTAQARALKQSSASTAFVAGSVEVQDGLMRAVVKGKLRRFIASQLTSTTPSCWIVEFHYAGGRLWVKTLREADCKKPFDSQPEGETL